MKKDQAKTLPIGMRVILFGMKGQVIGHGFNSFHVKWNDGSEGWIDYRDSKNVWVLGLQGTKK